MERRRRGSKSSTETQDKGWRVGGGVQVVAQKQKTRDGGGVQGDHTVRKSDGKQLHFQLIVRDYRLYQFQ